MPFDLSVGESRSRRDGPNPNALQGEGGFLWAEAQQLEKETKNEEGMICRQRHEMNGGITLNYISNYVRLYTGVRYLHHTSGKNEIKY